MIPSKSDDNLLIHGDNCAVMRAMATTFAGRFRLAYLDPPYNTGERKADAYDDAISSAKWRDALAETLAACWPLIAADGLLMIQIDDRELASVFAVLGQRQEPLISHVVVKMSELSGVKMSHAKQRLPKLKEHLLICGRQGANLRNIRLPKRRDKLAGYLKYYRHVIADPEAPVHTWKLLPLAEVAVRQWGWDPKADHADEALRALQVKHSERIVYRTNNALIARDKGSGIRRLRSPEGVEYIAWDDKQMLILADHLDEPLGDLWTDLSTINLNKEGGVVFRASKKPERLLQRCIALSTEPGDWVLDPFAGSATSAAVALKMGRHFVVIERGDHALSIAAPRLDAVISGDDQGGISRALGWRGGSAYRLVSALTKPSS
jgi:adenine-specific DNA-methyltransferase